MCAEDLTLVVRRAAREDVTVLQNRIEGRRIPQFERIGRLHIVVAIKHDGPAAGLMFVFRPDHRMSRGGNQLRLKTDPVQFFDQPMRTLGQLFRVGVIGRDAGESQKSVEVLKIRIAHHEE